MANNKHLCTSKLIIGALFLLAIYALLDHYLLTPRIAYVDTSRLMLGFREASMLQKQTDSAHAQFDKNIKALEDSAQAYMQILGKEYNNASAKRKAELEKTMQDWNEKVYRYRKGGQETVTQNHQKKMAVVIEKLNQYVAEYGKEHHYEIILGTTAGGSILYGKDGRWNLTDKLVKGLNERYK